MTDPGVVRRIADITGVGPGDRVVEVGPGLGSLTLALAETGASVLVVEKDRRLLPVLAEVLGRVDGAAPVVVQADALDVDWAGLLDGGRWTLAANLPYNVAVPIIIGVLEGAPMVERLVVMVQREVAERLCAQPGGRAIGVPTVKVGWYAGARIVMGVPPEVFTPRPRVQSAVVLLERREPPSRTVTPEQVFPLVEQAYRQRRKMLRSSLGAVVPVEAFAAAAVAPTCRPEELSVGRWADLAAAVADTR